MDNPDYEGDRHGYGRRNFPSSVNCLIITLDSVNSLTLGYTSQGVSGHFGPS